MLFHCLCVSTIFSVVLKGPTSPHTSHSLVTMPHCHPFFFSSLLSPIRPPLKHRNRVRGIRRPCLRHVPMLDQARPLHPVNVRQSNGLLARLIYTNVDEADAVVEAMSEDCGRYKRDDCKSTWNQPFRIPHAPRSRHCGSNIHRCADEVGRMRNLLHLLCDNFSSFAILP